MNRKGLFVYSVIAALLGILIFGVANAETGQPRTSFAPKDRPLVERAAIPQKSLEHPDGLILQDLNVVILLSDGISEAQSVIDYLLASGHVSTVDFINTEFSTPTLPDIEVYDAVICWTNMPPYDPVALGDLLADYIDLGKGVVVLDGAFSITWGLQGRFMAEYSPYAATDDGFTDVVLGTYDPEHPLMAGVSTVTDYFVLNLSLTGNAACVAWWHNDWPFVAYNSDNNRAVGINSFPHASGPWTGDLMLVILNSVLFVSGTQQDVPTLSEWGMLIMGLLLLAIGTVSVVRRRRAAISKAA